MKALIRYKINGKEYVEEVIDLVICNKEGKNILYAYSTADDDVCVVRPGRNLDRGFLVYPEKEVAEG